jgi:hypothetical protein
MNGERKMVSTLGAPTQTFGLFTYHKATASYLAEKIKNKQ